MIILSAAFISADLPLSVLNPCYGVLKGKSINAKTETSYVKLLPQ